MVAGLEAANAVLPSPLCKDPMLPLVATLAIFKAMLDSSLVAPKDKGQVIEAGDYLDKWLVIVVILVDKSIPTVVALSDAIPCSNGGSWRGPSKSFLLEIARGLAHRVLLTKVVELDGDIYPYFAALIVATLAQAGKTLVMLEGMQIMTIIREAFDNMLLKESGHDYDSYGLVSR